MAKLPDQRKIIDRGALQDRIAALIAEHGPAPEKLRPVVLEVLREALSKGRAEVRRRFDVGADGTEVVHANCFLIDQIIRTIHEFADTHVYPVVNPTAGERFCLVAVGGYGRGELAPFSDIDILFLFPYKPPPRRERLVEYVLYLLWDLGLKVGHATRPIDDCLSRARGDDTVLTTILEARYLSGDNTLYEELRRRFRDEVVAEKGLAFVQAKLTERNDRHQRTGDSRYVLEPNIKEGKGGLRDLHSLFWIAKFLYRVDDIEELVARGVFTEHEADSFAKAQNFLWTLRCHLHYLTGRAEERLTFDTQPEIGRRMGYTDHAGSRGVERFMKHYFLVAKEVGDLTRIFCAAIESEYKRPPRFSLRRLGRRRHLRDGFGLEDDRLTVTRDTLFEEDPVNLLHLFRDAQAYGLDIHPRALRLVTRNLKLVDAHLRENPEANGLFMEMLTAEKRDPEVTLRRLNEAGVLGRFIPDFGRVVAQMQYDMYHIYTVDEHTIRAVGFLHAIERGTLSDDHPLAASIFREGLSRRVLYLAVLLHDVAKGRGGDHSELGAEVALKLGPRLGLTAAQTETVAWLIRHHLVMSHTAQRRDVSDFKTIADFAETVGNCERLRLLLILTVVDMRATGPTVWNGWKAALLRQLYHGTNDRLSGRVPAARRRVQVRTAQEALRAELPEWDDAAFSEYAMRNYYGYWVGMDTPTHVRHAHMVREAERMGRALTVETRVDDSRAATEITVYTADHPGLFSRIAGAIALAGGNIVDAKIFTMTNGMALDTFWVQETGGWGKRTSGGALTGTDKLAALKRVVEKALTGELRLDRELAGRQSQLPARARVFKVAPRVVIDNTASVTHTVIEINGRDRPGLLYDLTRTLSNLGLQISSAKISTYGEKAIDVFYVKDVFGLRVESEAKLAQIRKALLDVLAEPESETTPPAAPEAAPDAKPGPGRSARRRRAKAGAGAS